jgi:hypothetical protein
MEDKNQNMIPDNIDRWILRMLGFGASGFGAYLALLKTNGSPVPMWLALTVTLLPLAATLFSFKPASGGDA